jgi:hypothetical protein
MALDTGGRDDVHFVKHVAHSLPFVAAEMAFPLPRAHQLALAAFGNAEAL